MKRKQASKGEREWYETSVMDSEAGAPDEPEAHAVPIISFLLSLALLSITLVFFVQMRFMIQPGATF